MDNVIEMKVLRVGEIDGWRITHEDLHALAGEKDPPVALDADMSRAFGPEAGPDARLANGATPGPNLGSVKSFRVDGDWLLASVTVTSFLCRYFARMAIVPTVYMDGTREEAMSPVRSRRLAMRLIALTPTTSPAQSGLDVIPSILGC